MKTTRFLLWSLFPVVLAFSACACSAEMALEEILGAGGTAPVFLDCRAVSPTDLEFQFSTPVRVVSFRLDPQTEPDSLGEGDLVRVGFSAPLGEGERYTAEILVEDEHRNTLNVLVPFRARNSRLPRLSITELFTESKDLTATKNPRMLVEYVEILAREAGNLGALRLYIAGHSASQPVLEFPPLEVKAGEFIMVHLRTKEAGWANETGDDLSLSGGTNALASARDLWVQGDKKLLHKKDLVYLLDQDDMIVDGVVVSESPAEAEWKSDDLKKAAALFGAQGVWLSRDPARPTPADAVDCSSLKTSYTKSISRYNGQEDANSAAGWYVTQTGNASPGAANKP
jgi:hypothetical protein